MLTFACGWVKNVCLQVPSSITLGWRHSLLPLFARMIDVLACGQNSACLDVYAGSLTLWHCGMRHFFEKLLALHKAEHDYMLMKPSSLILNAKKETGWWKVETHFTKASFNLKLQRGCWKLQNVAALFGWQLVLSLLDAQVFSGWNGHVNLQNHLQPHFVVVLSIFAMWNSSSPPSDGLGPWVVVKTSGNACLKNPEDLSQLYHLQNDVATPLNW